MQYTKTKSDEDSLNFQGMRDPSLSATAEELTDGFEISQTVISVD
jgi:hypothetical protein